MDRTDQLVSPDEAFNEVGEAEDALVVEVFRVHWCLNQTNLLLPNCWLDIGIANESQECMTERIAAMIAMVCDSLDVETVATLG